MSNLTLIIGNKNYSSWSLRPWMLMRHFRIDFEEKRIALFTETTDNELAPYFSDCKVPVLLDGDLVIWDSLSILEYLSEDHLDSRGWPAERRARALARSVSAEMHSSFLSVRNELPMNCRRKDRAASLSIQAGREIERIKEIWRRCRAEFGADGKWLLGEFSIADAMYAPMVLRFASYGIPLAGIEEAYARDVLEHPALQEWVEAGRQEKEVIDMYESHP